MLSRIDAIPPLQDAPVNSVGDPTLAMDAVYPPEKPVDTPPAVSAPYDYSMSRTLRALLNPR